MGVCRSYNPKFFTLASSSKKYAKITILNQACPEQLFTVMRKSPFWIHQDFFFQFQCYQMWIVLFWLTELWKRHGSWRGCDGTNFFDLRLLDSAVSHQFRRKKRIVAQLDFSSEWLGVPGMLLPDMTKEVQKVYRLGVSPSLVSRWREGYSFWSMYLRTLFLSNFVWKKSTS